MEKSPGTPYRSLPAPEGACQRAGEGLRQQGCGAGTRGNGVKPKEGGFRSDLRKKSLTLGVVRPWHRLPRGAVAALSLAGFKARLEGALSSLGWWQGPCPWLGAGTR